MAIVLVYEHITQIWVNTKIWLSPCARSLATSRRCEVVNIPRVAVTHFWGRTMYTTYTCAPELTRPNAPDTTILPFSTKDWSASRITAHNARVHDQPGSRSAPKVVTSSTDVLDVQFPSMYLTARNKETLAESQEAIQNTPVSILGCAASFVKPGSARTQFGSNLRFLMGMVTIRCLHMLDFY